MARYDNTSRRSRAIFSRVKLSETFTLDADTGQPTYYAPIFEVWGIPLPPGARTAV